MPAKVPPIELHCSLEDLAAVFDVHVRTLQRDATAGDFGPDVILVGNKYRVPLSGVEHYRTMRKIRKPAKVKGGLC